MGEKDRTHVVRKGGFFYRPKACGYTSDILEAGRWCEIDALRHVNPDAGVTAHLFSDYWPPQVKTQTSELIARLTLANETKRSALQLVKKYMQEEVDQTGVELLTPENRAIWDAVNAALEETENG